MLVGLWLKVAFGSLDEHYDVREGSDCVLQIKIHHDNVVGYPIQSPLP